MYGTLVESATGDRPTDSSGEPASADWANGDWVIMRWEAQKDVIRGQQSNIRLLLMQNETQETQQVPGCAYPHEYAEISGYLRRMQIIYTNWLDELAEM